MIKIIKANQNHSTKIWEWRNDPITKSMSLSKKSIDIKDHNIWFEKILNNKNIKTYVAEKEGIPVGIARYEPLDIRKSIFEISINIAPEKRSKGLGKILLRETIKYVFEEEEKCQTIKAKIKDANKKSIRLFKNLGFKLLKSEDHINILFLNRF